jgi:hypothetical protein
MRARHVVAGIALLALQAACSDRKQEPVQAAAPDPSERGATFAQDSLRDWFIETSVASIPGTEDEVIATLGAPDSVVRLPSANPNDPMAYDTIIEAYYPGISLSILKVDGAEVLQSVWVGDTTYVTGPIRIGTDTTVIRRLLGPPMLGGERPGYVCGMCSIANESVRFELVDGKVTGMLFTFPGS